MRAVLLLAAAAWSWAPRVDAPRLDLAGPPDCPAAALAAQDEPLFSIQELRVLSPESWPALLDDAAAAPAAEGARRSAAYWAGRSAGQTVRVGARSLTAAQLAQAHGRLAALLERGLSPEELRRELSAGFELLEAVTDAGGREGTITGYYDPEFEVLERDCEDCVPVHARPPDLESNPGGSPDWGRRREGGFEPHFARGEVYKGALAGRGLERYWMRRATDLNIAQTQGSFWGRLPGGARRRLSFDGANGHPFRAVGSALMACGLIEPGTPSSEILRRLRALPPERERAWTALNPRYVYFREAAASGGPWGALGVELVAGRSIAVDRARVPLGLAGFLMSRRPVADEEGNLSGVADLRRFVFTHDVGSAIRGPVRVDVFWGAGPRASAEAHNMMYPGKLYIFVPKASTTGPR